MMTALLLLFACGESATPELTDPTPRVQVAEAVGAEGPARRVLAGVVQARRDATLSARAGGTVVRRAAEPGESVDQGAAILELDAREARANVRAARAAERESEAALADARSRLSRLEQLGDGASAQALDEARTAVLRAEAALEAATARRELAEVQRSYMTVRAPFAGEVVDLTPEVGETVAPGTPVARVVDVSGTEVEVGLVEDEVGAARAEGTTFQVRGPDGVERPAELVHVAPAADPTTLTFDATLALEPDTSLRPGVPVDVVAELATAATGVRVPVQAVGADDGVWVVSGDDTVRRVAVRRLRERGSDVVVSGLEPGDRVVVRGPGGLAEGQPVVVLED
jgi:membrane fusion protein (multidrug efflux system)